MTVLLGFVGKLACDEIRAWLPRLADWLKTKAVRKLPQELQERYEEEWQSSLEEIPGSVSKLFFSASLLRASTRINFLASGPDISRWAASDIRRCFDFGVAALVLLFCAPFMLLVGIAIKLTSVARCGFSSSAEAWAAGLLKFPISE